MNSPSLSLGAATLIIGFSAVIASAQTPGPISQTWNYSFDASAGELLKLYPNAPEGFPNADFIGNRITDNATGEFTRVHIQGR